jgi:thermitase
MPTLAVMDNVLPSATIQHYTASEHQAELDTTNQFIVQFDDTVESQTDAETLVADLGAEWIEDIPAIQGAVIKFENVIEPEQLETLSSALVIEPNYTVQSLSTYPTNDPMLDLQWAWTKIDIPRLWDSTDLDSAITIAVIDSGVCFSHPDLQGRLLDNGYDFVDNDNDPSDQMGHGCAISGIIAANLDNGIGIAGIAPNVNILPIRVLDVQGVGTYANVMSAIYYAVEHDADIINLSLGGQNQSQLLEQAIDYAIDHGVQVVAGTGNTGQEGVLYPARYAPVIAVGSYDMDGNRSSFSTYGAEVDVLAPGENIVSTNLNGDYGYYSGTSMAAPHISALLALSGGAVQSPDFNDLMSTPQPTPTDSPTDDYVQALVATPTAPIPTMTPTSTIPVPTNTRPAPTNTPSAFQCSDLSLEDVIPVTYAVTIRIFNAGYPTTLESIEIAYPSIAEYPDLYVEGIYFNAEKFWQGDGTLTPPMYIDENVLSSDGVDRWNPTNPAALYNEITQFDLWFGSSPDFLDEYWTINDLAGTKLSFHNPADPQSPCVIQIPEDLYQPPPSPTPASHQCSDLSMTGEIYAGGNLLEFYLSNGGGDTDLQSIDWHFANANDPNAYIRGVSFGQGEIFWDDLWLGDETSISPLYMDHDVMSPDGLYYWQFADLRLPYNATKSLQVVLLNVDVPMRDNWVIEDFSGTTFSFYNPADPQSPCTLTIPQDLGDLPTPTPVSATAEATITPTLTPTNTPTPIFQPTPTDIPITCDTNVPAGDRYALLDAFQYAQTNTNIHTICLSGSLYTLSEYNNIGTDGRNGFPLITRDLTLVGNGATIRALEPYNYRYFEVSPGVSFTIEGVKFVNGDSSNGGMLLNNQGVLTVVDSTFSNASGYLGGAIHNNQGDLFITNSDFYDNEAYRGGAIYSTGSYPDNLESVTIFGSSFLRNTAERGGAISSIFDLSVYNSKFIGNEGTADSPVFTSYGSYPNLRIGDQITSPFGIAR